MAGANAGAFAGISCACIHQIIIRGRTATAPCVCCELACRQSCSSCQAPGLACAAGGVPQLAYASEGDQSMWCAVCNPSTCNLHIDRERLIREQAGVVLQQRARVLCAADHGGLRSCQTWRLRTQWQHCRYFAGPKLIAAAYSAMRMIPAQCHACMHACTRAIRQICADP
jgi:hypothetical protein